MADKEKPNGLYYGGKEVVSEVPLFKMFDEIVRETGHRIDFANYPQYFIGPVYNDIVLHTNNKRSNKKVELSYSISDSDNRGYQTDIFYIGDIFHWLTQKAELRLSHLKSKRLLNTILSVTEISTPGSRLYDVFDIKDVEGNTLSKDYMLLPIIEIYDAEGKRMFEEILDKSASRRESREEKPPISDPTPYLNEIVRLYFKEKK